MGYLLKTVIVIGFTWWFYMECKIKCLTQKSLALKEQGYSEFICGHYNAALKYYSAALSFIQKLCPKQKASLYYNMSMCYFKVHDYYKTIEMLQMCIKLDPYHVKSRVLLAKCYLLLDRMYEFNKTVEDMSDNLCKYNLDINEEIAVLIKLRKINAKIRQLYENDNHNDTLLGNIRIALQILPENLTYHIINVECHIYLELKEDFSESIDSIGSFINSPNVCSNLKDQAYYCLALMDKKNGQYNSAISMCTDVITKSKYTYGNENYTKTLLLRAQCYNHKNMFEQSANDYKEILQMDPYYTKHNIHDLLKEALNKLEQFRKQQKLIQQNALKDKGNEFFNINSYWKALQFYQDALALGNLCNNTTETLYFNCGLVYSKLKEYNKATIELTKALNMKSTYLKALLLRAECYKHLEDFEKCIEDYKKALRQSYSAGVEEQLNDAMANFEKFKIKSREKLIREKKNKGNSLYQSGHYEQALKVYRDALEMEGICNNLYAEIYYNIALVYSKMNCGRKVISNCTEALSLKSKYLKALLLRARYYAEAEMFKESINDYEMALKQARKPHIEKSLKETRQLWNQFKVNAQKKRNQQSLRDRGNSLFQSKCYREALDVYKEALKMGEFNIDLTSNLLYNIALCSRYLYGIDEVIAECSKVLKFNDNYTKALLLRAQCHKDLLQFDKCINDYELACKQAPTLENKNILQEANKEWSLYKKQDNYAILGLAGRKASKAEIKTAYHNLALDHHPDRHSNKCPYDQKCEEVKFKRINEAYCKLLKNF